MKLKNICLLMLVALLGIFSSATAVDYEFSAQVPNSGPTNFVGTNYKSPDDSGTTWMPLQVGDTITRIDDFGQTNYVPVGAKLPEVTRSNVNRDFFNHPPLNTIPRETRTVSNQPVVSVYSAPTKSSVTAPIASVNYDFVRQVPNSGQTNFVGTNYLPTSDNDPNWTGWTPLNPGDTFSGVDDFGNKVSIPVGAKLVLPKRSLVNSWLTLSRKGGALRVIN